MRIFAKWVRLQLLLLLVALPVAPIRADIRVFDQSTYNRMSLEKKLVILDFHTFQCAKCRAQSPQLEKLLDQERYANVAILQIPRELAKKFMLQFDISTDEAIVFMYQRKMVDKMEGHIQVPVLELEMKRILAEIKR
jgi:thiol-disulfide isomerase/thioredoxin